MLSTKKTLNEYSSKSLCLESLLSIFFLRMKWLCVSYRLDIKVVFNMLDKDKDDEISKRDLFRLFGLSREQQEVFPINNFRAVELIECERGDRFTKADFTNIVTRVPYTVFPAFRL